MIIRENELLSGHTTVKIGGTARLYYIPESVSELQELIKKESGLLFIGGGSNLLIAEHEFDKVVDLGHFDSSIRDLGGGVFGIGASARLQDVIHTINLAGYGGIEYLISVPGLIGGAIAMNAGRGKEYHQSIGDHVVSLEVIRDGELCSLEKNECNFDYRDSVFKNSEMIITSAVLKFPPVPLEQSRQAIDRRLEYCREKQDNSCPNFGSVFCESNPYIIAVVKILGLRAGGCRFSRKTYNWLLNDGGSFQDAIRVISRVEKMHIVGGRCKREVIVWE